MVKTYTYGNSLLSSATSLNAQASTVSYFTTDGHGNVRELTDSSGVATDRYDYDAFGNLVYVATLNGSTLVPQSPASWLLNPDSSRIRYLYCGEQYDPDLGLYYNRARYLNPDSGRFWSMDSYEGSTGQPVSLHKYTFTNGDPVAYIDPSGRMALFELSVTQGVICTLQKMAVRAYLASGVSIVVQFRLIQLLRPLAEELDLLGTEVRDFSPAAAERIENVAGEVRKVISPGHVGMAIATPAIFGAFWGTFGSTAVTAARIFYADYIARKAVGLAAKGMLYQNGRVTLSISGDVDVRESAMRAFVGNINPAQDISTIRLAIMAAKEGHFAESREHLADALKSLGRYGSFDASIDYH